MNSKIISRVLLTICLSMFVAISGAKADIVDLVADATMSSADISIAGEPAQTSATSGTGKIDLVPPNSPFGTAQITDLNIIYDDALTFSFLGGLVTANTSPGNVMVDLITPGAAGSVTGGQFDQLGTSWL